MSGGAPGQGPPPEQVQRTLQWVGAAFREFYLRNPPPMPPRFGRREFGFMWIGKKFFLRHRGMTNKQELHTFLVKDAPNHCYYSTAYYKDPNQTTMQAKEWLGADLIFDLDADHLSEEAKSWSFEKQLRVVKGEALKLLNEFVLGDLGFDADHVRVVFSGGRGFHIHVDDPRVLAMDAAARREVVDYVVGRGVEVDGLVRERTAALSKGFQGRVNKERYLLFPKPTDPGWAGRYSRGVLRMIEEMSELPDAKTVVRYAKERQLGGIGEKTAQSILELPRQKDNAGRSQIQVLREEGKTNNPVLMKLVRLEDLAVAGVNEEKGESDEPVTADIKRLIRLPGSLHGKTSLRVTPVAIDDLKDFDPLRDAVAFGETPVRMVVSKPERVKLAGVEYDCEPGPQELPMRYALFLALRRRALRAV